MLSPRSNRAFSLLELAIALIIAGMVAGMAMKLTATTDRNECYTASKAQVEKIKEAIDRFALRNRRFPLPARRYVGTDSHLYGKETPIGNIDDLDSVINSNGAGTVAVFGTVPYVSLSLSMDDSIDCWGNKLTYVVTKDLAAEATFDNNVEGAITISVAANTRIATQNPPTPDGFGYAVIVHGEDQLGAVKANWSDYTAANQPQTPIADRLAKRKWCDADGTLKTPNCLASNANLMAAPFNNGDNTAKYFDDVITVRGKPWRIGGTYAQTNVYCWGNNSMNALGIGAAADESVPAVVLNGPNDFKSVTVGDNYFACGLTVAGKAYCWGRNRQGEIGNGTVLVNPNVVTSPTAVSGNHTFLSLSAGGNHVCGVTTAGEAYCWGDGTEGKLGYGGVGAKLVPEKVSFAGTFTQISAGSRHTCAIDSAGAAYCWGHEDDGSLGVNMTAASYRPTPQPVDGGHTFSKIAAGDYKTCGITTAGYLYCWGDNRTDEWSAGPGWTKGGLGTGNTTQDRQATPQQVLGGHTYVEVTVGEASICGITTSGKTYCWRDDDQGALGNGGNPLCTFFSCTDSIAPSLVGGGYAFTKLSSGSSSSFCALLASGKAYCWGRGGGKVLGSGSIIDRNVPGPVSGGLFFSSIDTSSRQTCAVVGTPPKFNGGWSDWSACTGACNGGAGTQTRSCLTAPCTGALSQACYNPAPCMMSYRDPPAAWSAPCLFGASCPAISSACPYIGGCNSTKSTNIIPGYVCTSTGKKQYEWHCIGSGIPAIYNCRSGEYNDASCP